MLEVFCSNALDPPAALVASTHVASLCAATAACAVDWASTTALVRTVTVDELVDMSVLAFPLSVDAATGVVLTSQADAGHALFVEPDLFDEPVAFARLVAASEVRDDLLLWDPARVSPVAGRDVALARRVAHHVTPSELWVAARTFDDRRVPSRSARRAAAREIVACGSLDAVGGRR